MTNDKSEQPQTREGGELREALQRLVDLWRDEDCKHAWSIQHAKRDEPAELICAEELAAALRAAGQQEPAADIMERAFKLADDIFEAFGSKHGPSRSGIAEAIAAELRAGQQAQPRKRLTAIEWKVIHYARKFVAELEANPNRVPFTQPLCDAVRDLDEAALAAAPPPSEK